MTAPSREREIVGWGCDACDYRGHDPEPGHMVELVGVQQMYCAGRVRPLTWADEGEGVNDGRLQFERADDVPTRETAIDTLKKLLEWMTGPQSYNDWMGKRGVAIKILQGSLSALQTADDEAGAPAMKWPEIPECPAGHTIRNKDGHIRCLDWGCFEKDAGSRPAELGDAGEAQRRIETDGPAETPSPARTGPFNVVNRTGPGFLYDYYVEGPGCDKFHCGTHSEAEAHYMRAELNAAYAVARQECAEEMEPIEALMSHTCGCWDKADHGVGCLVRTVRSLIAEWGKP